MLRDGLNLYGAVWVVTMVNMLFWFIATPTGISDSIKTIVTSMAAVLTTTMTLRIVLNVRGSLEYGGSYSGSSTGGAHSTGASHSHAISTRVTQPGAPNAPNVLNINSHGAIGRGQTITIDEMPKIERDWADADGKSSVNEGKDGILPADDHAGVKITTYTETDYSGAR